MFFDQNQSIYKQQEKLDTPQSGRGGMWARFGGGSQNIIHTNLATGQQTNQQELFSKLFLVNREVKAREWNFTGESKQIGQYMAQKFKFKKKCISQGTDKDIYFEIRKEHSSHTSFCLAFTPCVRTAIVN